jgi:hypothetical protein
VIFTGERAMFGIVGYDVHRPPLDGSVRRYRRRIVG